VELHDKTKSNITFDFSTQYLYRSSIDSFHLFRSVQKLFKKLGSHSIWLCFLILGKCLANSTPRSATCFSLQKIFWHITFALPRRTIKIMSAVIIGLFLGYMGKAYFRTELGVLWDCSSRRLPCWLNSQTTHYWAKQRGLWYIIRRSHPPGLDCA
jgi:hypothetical protein